jgi:hypothetical protein
MITFNPLALQNAIGSGMSWAVASSLTAKQLTATANAAAKAPLLCMNILIIIHLPFLYSRSLPRNILLCFVGGAHEEQTIQHGSNAVRLTVYLWANET